jgi:polyhydroxyalkanoate synthesis regulator phasin
MNPDTLVQSLQKGFHTTLGAASFMVDLVQYPDQRDTNLERLKSDFDQLKEEWAVKGEQTEQEARVFVEKMWNQPSGSPAGTTASEPAGPTAPAGVQSDLKDLTEQIAAIRAELEKLREQDS